MIRVLAALEFGAGQSGPPALRRGWSEPEDHFVWTDGKASSLMLPAPPSPEGVTLDLTIMPFVHRPGLTQQRAELLVNGQLVSRRVLGGLGVWRVELPEACLRRAGQLRLVLQHPDATSPQSVGNGNDRRKLGLCLRKLVLWQDTDRAALPQPAGPARLENDFRFGWNEPTEDMLMQGWGFPEEGYVWSLGHQSVLRVKLRDPGTAYVLVLDMQPFVSSEMPRQRIAIGAGGKLQHYVALGRRTVLALNIPPEPGGPDFIDVSFDNLDAAAPRTFGLQHDGRNFAFMLRGVYVFAQSQPAPDLVNGRCEPIQGSLGDGSLQRAVHAASGLSIAEITTRFESLGNAREFGALQQLLGQEPGGLFRFAGIPAPQLADGLVRGFAGLGRPDALLAGPRDGAPSGLPAVDEIYSVSFGAPEQQGMSAADAERSMAEHLPFLVRKFLQDAVAADRIFVYQQDYETTRPEAEAVLAALSLWGDVTLLWTVYDPGQPPGSVMRLGPRLLCGHLDYSPGGVLMARDETWLSILTNAFLLK